MAIIVNDTAQEGINLHDGQGFTCNPPLGHLLRCIMGNILASGHNACNIAIDLDKPLESATAKGDG